MYFSLILAGFIAGISPFWALIIIIAYSFRHFLKNKSVCLGLFVLAAITSAWLNPAQIRPLALADAIVGVAVPAFVYFKIFSITRSHHRAFIPALISSAGYGVIRQTVFGGIIKDQLRESSEQSLILLQELFSGDPELQSMAEMSSQLSYKAYTDYGAGLWFITIFIALFIGSHWLAAREKISWKQDWFIIPYNGVYILIAALVTFLIPVTRNIGANLLLMTLPVFFVQGTGVVYYFWVRYRSKKRFLLFYLLSVVLLNYIFVLFLIVLGILDIWLMFRQRHEDKINTYNQNKQDLEE